MQELVVVIDKKDHEIVATVNRQGEISNYKIVYEKHITQFGIKNNSLHRIHFGPRTTGLYYDSRFDAYFKNSVCTETQIIGANRKLASFDEFPDFVKQINSDIWSGKPIPYYKNLAEITGADEASQILKNFKNTNCI